jgi:hypothetical protein
MAKRRKGTIPQRIMLTQATVDRIDAYQAQHQIRSFSAAAETLLRIGLEESPSEIVAPIIVSTIRHEMAKSVERVVKLIVYDIIETGVAQRLAGAAVRDIGRMKHDDPERYDRIKAAAITDARRTLARTNIDKVLQELYGDREGELHHPWVDVRQSGEGGDEDREVLHLPGRPGSGAAAVVHE